MYKSISLTFALSLFAVTAFAAAPAFEAVDIDQDSMISAEEAATAGITTELFVTLDVDQDGALSMEEYKALN
jgi:Ca2+-binding EF-hand superfamily protein